MKKVLLIVLTFATSIMYAQTNSGFKGRVLDETNQPLPGATIYIKSLKTGTSTDNNGYYKLLKIPNGEYSLEVSFIGYQSLEKSIVINNKIEVYNYKLKPLMNLLNEVTIKGSIAKGQAKALNQQKEKDNITNIISADQVGKFPDANIGDALKRIPGISMQNDQGEARDIIIRGLAPQLNSVTLNGDRIPSAEGDNRRVQMDLIPSDMIQTIEVNKAVTPDMEADAIGGSVNLITRSAPSKFRAAITTSYGKNPVRDDGTNYSVSGLFAGRSKNKKFGAVLNASYNSNNYGSDNIEFEWKNENLIAEHDIRKYDVKRIRKSIALNLDWKPDANNTISIKSMFNTRDDRENRFRLRYKFDDDDTDDTSDDIYKITRQTKGGINSDDNKNRRLERQKVYKIGIDGKHIIFNNITVDWKLSTSEASEKRPNERYITFVDKQDVSTISQIGLNTQKPYFLSIYGDDNDASKFEIDEISQENQYTKEQKISSKIDITVPLTAIGVYKNSIKFGYKLKSKEKLRENDYSEFDVDNYSQFEFLSATPNSSQTLNSFLAGNQYKSGFFATNALLGSLDLIDGEAVLEEFVPQNYNAKEDIYAFYGMLNQKLGNKFSFILGLRAEKTAVDYTGFQIDVETAETLDDVVKTLGSQTYTNWLPNVHLKYKPLQNLIVRAAWTNTIARPNYYDLVPYQNFNSDDREASFGNPNLKAATATNLDLMGEYYFKNVGIISFGGFYKNINDFIYEKTTNENLVIGSNPSEEYEVTRPYNGASAKIHGFEFALQRKLNFLPGFLRNLTFYGNYTYTGSETAGIEGREDGLTLSGAVKNMLNTSLAYETSKFTLRGSLNFADDYIDTYEGDVFDDTYYDEQLFVDINASYKIAKGFRIFAEGKNLTNQALRFYQGAKNRTKQAEYYNYNWNVGLKYNF
jgi:TonB-dependent receptor